MAIEKQAIPFVIDTSPRTIAKSAELLEATINREIPGFALANRGRNKPNVVHQEHVAIVLSALGLFRPEVICDTTISARQHALDSNTGASNSTSPYYGMQAEPKPSAQKDLNQRLRVDTAISSNAQTVLSTGLHFDSIPFNNQIQKPTLYGYNHLPGHSVIYIPANVQRYNALDNGIHEFMQFDAVIHREQSA